ncbi:MAG: hypothetical protein OH319_00830 [Candidatus Parvarchaeota archaeon]|nr:hypothetical protein [Candidatus Jingweiarchaeum tengchongense]MCW1297878.1 hypothetical protein [Candidatus Jingweiarchaeum tengchongense]MCW1299889.1 hypothetical protein [Candidatus Jingweiarchaeum tengchongense]MCW1305107.1 hypothetical protein [Candidatus Jingweiarchaeum tengchongense]MCW1305169.1 hypothetical protein [Candidatus Jingweiarchaeum tengchongense]
MASVFVDVIDTLRNMGIFDVFLPFLLIFAIVFGALEKTQVFGEEKKNVNGIVAFAIAMIVVGTSRAIGIINNFVPWVGIIAIALVCFLMLSALLFGGDVSKMAENYKNLYKVGIVIIGAILVYILLYYITGSAAPAQWVILSKEDFSLLVFFVIFFGAIYLIVKSSESKKTKE